MIVRILGDKRNNFNGILVAQFEEDGKTHELTFDMDNWENQILHGLISGGAIVFSYPEPMQLRFDKDYEVDKESARKIYRVLAQHHWHNI